MPFKCFVMIKASSDRRSKAQREEQQPQVPARAWASSRKRQMTLVISEPAAGDVQTQKLLPYPSDFRKPSIATKQTQPAKYSKDMNSMQKTWHCLYSSSSKSEERLLKSRGRRPR